MHLLPEIQELKDKETLSLNSMDDVLRTWQHDNHLIEQPIDEVVFSQDLKRGQVSWLTHYARAYAAIQTGEL